MFTPIGNIRNYVKSLDLKQQWEKNKNDPTKIKPSLFGGESLFGVEQKNDSDLSTYQSIRMKLDSGKQLSSSEMDFLRRKYPDLYRKAVEIEYEREQYERDLRRCKTKEEVRSLRMSRVSVASADVRAGKAGNGGGDDIRMHTAAITDEHHRFVGTTRYKGLPADRHDMEEQKRRGTYREPAAAERRRREDWLDLASGKKRNV